MALPRPSMRRGLVSMSSRMSLTICLRPRLGADDLLHRAPALLELGAGQVGHALGLGLEPLVDLGGRGQMLVDVAGFVPQVEHHAVLDGLVELVGVDEAAERLEAGGLVGLEQRRAGEADEHRAGQQLLHGVVHLAGLRAVRLVDEDEEVALGGEVLRDAGVQLADELVRRPRRASALAVGAAELVDERADEPLGRLVERVEQVDAAARCGRSPRRRR